MLVTTFQCLLKSKDKSNGAPASGTKLLECYRSGKKFGETF